MRVIVIGAGANGLTAAALLRRRRHDVLLLEQRDAVGGLAAGGPVGDGRHAGILHDTEHVSPAVLEATGARVTWRDPPGVHGPDGTLLTRPAALARLAEVVRPLATAIAHAPPPSVTTASVPWALLRRAVTLRRLGPEPLLELARMAPASLDDLAAELWDDPAQRGLAMPPALLGAWMGPRSPTSAVGLLLQELLRGQEVVGGPAALVEALAAVAPKPRLGARVARVLVHRRRAVGVVLADGQRLAADAVISCIGPRRTLRELVRPVDLPAHLAPEVDGIRVRGVHAKVHLSLTAPLFPHERVRIGDPVHLERAFDDARHGRLPAAPGLDVRQLGDVASILVLGAPHALAGGWTGAARDALREAVLDVLSRHVPDVRARVRAAEVLSPADLEDRFGLEGGHLLHGEVALDQLWVMRPGPHLARASTGLPGLLLGSAGMHPGVPLTLLPGWLAARAAQAGG